MALLPQMPVNTGRYVSQCASFDGLNLRPEPKDGQIVVGENLSTEAYPWLTQRAGREVQSIYQDPSAIFGWDQLVVVDGGVLKYNGEALTNVSPGEKQFAVVNTKLVVWPDKIYVDLATKSIVNMASKIVLEDITMDTSSITGASFPNGWYHVLLLDYQNNHYTYINVYGSSPNAIMWDEEHGWTSDGTTPLTPDIVAAADLLVAANELYEFSAIVIPKVTIDDNTGAMTFSIAASYDGGYSDKPDSISREEENNMGYYAVINQKEDKKLYASIFKYGDKDAIVSNVFTASDVVTISGLKIKANNLENIAIKEVKDGVEPDFKTTISFESNIFLKPRYLFTADKNYAQGSYYITGRGYLRFKRIIKKGEQILWFGDEFLWQGVSYSSGYYLYDEESRKILKNLIEKLTYKPDDYIGNIEYEFEDTSENFQCASDAFSIQRAIPDFSFICEKDNRLWGVTNHQKNRVWDEKQKKYFDTTSRVIMASALGEPDRFWTFDGLDTDSYQVAVASKGDFTGLIAYADTMLAMKEQEIFKVYGDYPSNFQIVRDDVPGTADGCGKSAVVVAGVLYYTGVDGVYAYTGSSQSLISAPLGTIHAPRRAVAGSDGVRYYLNLDLGQPAKTFVYDPLTGLWSVEDEASIAQFAQYQGQLYAVESTSAGDEVWRKVPEASYQGEMVRWSAELAPADEQSVRKKRYQWLRGQIYLGQNAYAKIFYAADDGDWILGQHLHVPGDQTFQIPLAPMRARELRVKLEGEGRFYLKSLERAFYAGSEMP